MTTAQRERNLEALNDMDDADLLDRAHDAGEGINHMQDIWLRDNDWRFVFEFSNKPSCEWSKVAERQHELFTAWTAKQLREKYTLAGGAPWFEVEPEEEA